MNDSVANRPNVRLSEDEIATLKAAVRASDPQGKVFLFGSRTDVSQRGGDIDLLIVSGKLSRKDLGGIRWRFFDRFGEQKIDIVLDDGTLQTPFARKIFPKAVEL